MTQEHEPKPGMKAGEEQPGREPEPSAGEAHDHWLPPGHNVNQVQDEPIPASHQDDGRPEPGEESPAPGAGASRPAGGSR